MNKPHWNHVVGYRGIWTKWDLYKYFMQTLFVVISKYVGSLYQILNVKYSSFYPSATAKAEMHLRVVVKPFLSYKQTENMISRCYCIYCVYIYIYMCVCVYTIYTLYTHNSYTHIKYNIIHINIYTHYIIYIYLRPGKGFT